MDDFISGCVSGFLTAIGMAVILLCVMLVSPVAALILGIAFVVYMLSGLLGAVGDLFDAIDAHCFRRR